MPYPPSLLPSLFLSFLTFPHPTPVCRFAPGLPPLSFSRDSASLSAALFQGDIFDLPLLKCPHPVPVFISFSSRANLQSMLLKRKLHF